MRTWVAALSVGLIALAGPPADCNLVGVRVMTDDLNGAHRVCRQPDGTTTVGPIEAVPTPARPPEDEAPVQYFPLDDSSVD